MNIACPQCGTTNRVPEDRLQDQPVGGRCGVELLATKPVAMTDATLPDFGRPEQKPWPARVT